MKTFSLALRNLLRNRRRSLTTLLAMVVGLTAILLFGGYRSNITYGMETGFIQGSGHLQIQRQGYFLEGGDNPTAYGIADYQHIIDLVKQDKELASMLVVVTPTLQLGGLAGNFSAGVSRSVLALGVVVPERNQMLKWNDYGMQSYAKPLPLNGSNPDAVVIGEGVARKIKLCKALQIPDCKQDDTPAAPADNSAQAPGDIAALSALEQGNTVKEEGTRIEMLAATSHGAPNVASLSVITARNMGIKALDDVYMAMHLSQAQKLIYGNGTAQVTAIQIQLKHTSQMQAARARLQQLLDQNVKGQTLELLDFKVLNPMYGQTVQFMNSMFGFISILIGVIVLFTIGNTMSTAVVERTVEIGTLRAMGLRRSGLRRLFLCEGVLLGAIGAVCGLLGSLVIAYLINNSGAAWTPPGYSYAYLIQVRVWQDIPLLIGSIIGLLLVTVISAWLPANRASRLMIVDALRHV
ncbi:permease [Undibacterium sp. KW1]|uniref:ABC transporter permease n=1 Tax=Undibacterium sp. KW1 TaxID=2058624 RepID=UPI001331C839|nr:FtsX-like permease family protein [Undibacterium sp. KW1]BBB61669.1 permease [Undibacterium sp. KW1]